MLQDLRYAIRSLLSRPLVTSVAVLSLALGIGVNTAIFSVFDRLLLRRLPVPSPEEIVLVTSPGPHPGARDSSNAGGSEGLFSYPLFRDIERFETGAIAIAAHRDFSANFAYRGQTSSGAGLLVSGRYFSALEIRPALGRLFGPEDDRTPGAHPVVILTHDYWATRFGADPNVLNSTLVVNGSIMTIVGVAPKGFTGTTLRDAPQVFIPLSMAGTAFRDTTSRNTHWLYAFGRLASGVTREQAEAQLNPPFAALIRDVEFPILRSRMSEQDSEAFQRRTISLTDGALPRTRGRDDVRTMMVLLFAVTAFVLAIACANVANLVLTRVSDRTREISVRLSLGASARRVIRLLLIEVLMLGVLGSVGALLVARMTIDGLGAIVPPFVASMFTIEIDGRILLFALTTGLGASLIFGLFPAINGVRSAAATGMRPHSGHISGVRGANRFRASMATTQVALATALLAVSGLFIVSLMNVSRVELGFRREGLVTFQLSPYLNNYTREQSLAFLGRVEDELRALPDVTSVTASTVPLLASGAASNRVTVEGFVPGPDADTSASYARISNDYFRTMGIQVVAGRDFARTDDIGAEVAIVNDAFVKKFGLGDRAVGAHMAMGLPNQPLNIEIVGLARDAKYNDVRETPPAQFYLPYRRAPVAGLTFYVRGNADSRALIAIIPPLVKRLDGKVPIDNLRSMDDQVWENMTRDRILTTLSSAFAGLAVILAAIGLYAVLAYGVARRLREIGIRIALGARSGDVRRLVLSQITRISLIGGVVGVSLALALGRLGQAMLFGVQDYSLPIIGGAALLVFSVVLMAAVLPVRRATLVDPVSVLRSE